MRKILLILFILILTLPSFVFATEFRDSVNTSANDAWYYNGGWSTAGISVVLGSYNSQSTQSGCRFDSVAIPQGSVIDSAFLEIQSRLTSSKNTVNVIFKGEDTASSATFSTSANYLARIKTTAKVSWSAIPAWTTGSWYRSPDIKTIPQEIVSRSDWVSLNALTIFIEDSSSTTGASRIGLSYDYAGAGYSVKLIAYYTYTAPAGGTSDSIGVNTGSGWGQWIYPAYLKEGSNMTFTLAGDTLTIAGQAGGATDSSDVAGWNFATKKDVGDSANAVRGDIKDSGDVYYPSKTDFGKITDDSTHWNTAYGWGDWSGTVGKITDDTTSWKAAAESVGVWDNGYLVKGTDFAKVTDDSTALIASKDSVAVWDNGYLVKSTDFSKVTDDSTALLAAKDSVAAWDNAGIATGNITNQTITKNDIDTTSSDIPFNNAYKGTTATAESLLITHGEFNKVADDSTALKAAKDSVAAWDNGDIFKKNVQCFSATIILPKNVSDSLTAIPIFAVETGWAPNGVYVHTVGIKTDNSSTYSVIFKEYSAPNTATNAIDTIATSSSYEASGTPSDTAIAAGSIIYAIIPTTTGTKSLQVWGTWYKQ